MKKIIPFLLNLTIFICCISDPYQEQIQTGSNDLSNIAPSLPTYYQYFWIPYSSSFAGSYQYCLSLEELQIDYKNNDKRYSYNVGVSSLGASGMNVYMSSAHSDMIKRVRLRYLLINSDYEQFFSAQHYRYQYWWNWHGLNINSLISGWIYTQTTSQSQHYAFLLAIDIVPSQMNNISITIYSRYQNNDRIQAIVTTDLSSTMAVYMISFDILIFDREKLKNQRKYHFTTLTINNIGDSLIGYAGQFYTYHKNLQTYDLFYGVNKYEFKHAFFENLDFNLFHTGSGLNAQIVQNQKMSVSFIIFHRLKACKTNQDFVWNTTSQYCQCPQAQYQYGNICLACISNCLNCTDDLSCDLCEDNYMLTNTTTSQCIPDCSLIDSKCKNCSIDQCNQCKNGYELTNDNMSCEPRCGDGKWISLFEECDDGNLNDKDGCSSTCQEQVQFFQCVNTKKNTSDCTLKDFTIKPVSVVKEQLANKVLISFELIPDSVYGQDAEQWLTMFDQNQNGYTINEAQYDTNISLLKVKMDYDENADFSAMKISLSPQKLSSSIYGSMQTTQIDLPSTSQNNLSLVHYSDNVYLMAQIVKYISYILVVVALIFFVVGNLGAKIAALECISLFQLTALLQLSLDSMSPTFGSLGIFILTLGATPIYQPTTYYEYTELPEYLKNIQINRNTFCFINYFLIFLILPFLTGLILKCAARNKPSNPGTRMIHRSWKNALATFTFYPLVLLTYGFMLCLAVNLRYFQLSPSTAFGLVGCLLFTTTLVTYLILMTKEDTNFGSFKNKFQRGNICEYHYVFECAQRAITSSMLVFIGPGIISVASVCVLFTGFALFIGIKKPYALGIWKRALFIKIMAVFLCLIYIGVGCTQQGGILSVFAPFIILTILLVALIVTFVLSLKDIKQYCQDTYAKLDPPLTTQECNKKQRQDMQQKMFQSETNPFLTQRYNALSGLKLIQDKWFWGDYPKLYSIDPEQVIEKDIKNIQQEEEEEEGEVQKKQNEIVYQRRRSFTMEQQYNAI